MNLIFVFSCVLLSVHGQNPAFVTTEVPQNLHNGLTERIGNFSIELLYHSSRQKDNNTQNLIMSPITVWTVLAVISEGANGNTALQINHALRISSRQRDATRAGFLDIFKYLEVHTNTVELQKVNAIFADTSKLLLPDFKEIAENNYKTKVVPVNFQEAEKTADIINKGVSQVTRGKINKLVDPSYLSETQMILTSALYFKGQWTVPFNTTSTTKMPFYSSNTTKIGEVNMMYHRFAYPFSNIKELQARVIELPYGKENRLSMLIMLPNPGVSLEDMFLNFGKVPLDTLFKELRISEEEYGDDEVDCFIPRFKIESDLDLTGVLREKMGIADLFDQALARLPFMARTPLYVTKVVHKAQIEVTEDGTTASGVTAAEFSNRIGVVQFIANRPFCYMIIEKVTNSIVFGGLYQNPSLY